jgi:predicted transposase YbfD/YdcC
LRAEDVQTAADTHKGHGRCERRTLTSSTWLNAYLDWPGVQQVFRVERQRQVGSACSVEVAYFITSLSRDAGDAARLLELVRAHWGIENRSHYVRDVTLGEDACRVRKGSGPQVLAALRNVVVHLLDQVDASSKAAATRRFAAHPEEAILLLLTF